MNNESRRFITRVCLIPGIAFKHIVVILIYKIKDMVAVVGTYQNGYVKLDKEYASDKPVKVILTFLEDVRTTSEKPLSMTDFSFAESREFLSNYKGSFSDTVIEERRSNS